VAALGFLDVGEAGAGFLTSVCGGLGSVAGSAGVMALLSRGRLTTWADAGRARVRHGDRRRRAHPRARGRRLRAGHLRDRLHARRGRRGDAAARLAPDHVLGRIAGVTEATTGAALALGSLAGGLLADSIGARASFVRRRRAGPALVLMRRRRLQRLESGAPVAEREYALLRDHEIFAPLPIADTERLARALNEVRPPEGAEVITEGETGDRFLT